MVSYSSVQQPLLGSVTRSSAHSGQDGAACSNPQVDPKIFFREARGGNDDKTMRLAKQVCVGCPVVQQCWRRR
ncbi:WhiB family transcriptional regulator [Streptomyces sp. CA-251387]|uniref:WhiB family transcriptional regulator n=1 Tax=Streptomyces sp. CA-251387 TaxID=3240064 RepID=UPI003D8EA5A4